MVKGLRLAANGLSGTLPASYGNWTNIQELELGMLPFAVVMTACNLSLHGAKVDSRLTLSSTGVGCVCAARVLSCQDSFFEHHLGLALQEATWVRWAQQCVAHACLAEPAWSYVCH